MNCVKFSQKHGGKDTNNLVNFCHPPLNCVNKPKYVHGIRGSSQKQGWNGHKKKSAGTPIGISADGCVRTSMCSLSFLILLAEKVGVATSIQEHISLIRSSRLSYS